MKRLSKQKQYLYDLYKDGEWRCSTAIQFVRDFRKRISEMNREGFNFESMKCDMRCGVKHQSGIHMYRLAEAPKRPVYEYELVNGVRVPHLTYIPL